MLKEVRVIGKMTFPHQVRQDAAEMVKESRGFEEWNEKKKCKETVFRDVLVLGSGTIDMLCNPEQPIEVGDTLKSLYYSDTAYKVTDITVERPAKGDWGFLSFIPLFQRCVVARLSQEELAQAA